MLAPVNAQGPPPNPAPEGPDVATCILALIDSVSSTEAYTLEARDGELFVTPVQPRATWPSEIARKAGERSRLHGF